MTTKPTPNVLIGTDAREFGQHMRQGGWRLGLLVARNVKISPGRVAPETLLPKVNATEFARRAGTSNDRVIRHYAAWERAANAGLVPHADTLNPGTEVDLDVERLPAWGPIYNAPLERTQVQRRAARPPAPEVTTRRVDTPMPRVAAPTAEPSEDDAQVSRALTAAAERARSELAQLRDADATRDPDDRQDARINEWNEDVRYAINALAGHARRLFDAARDPEWADTAARERAAKDMIGISKQLAMIAELATAPEMGTVTDEALAQLLNN